MLKSEFLRILLPLALLLAAVSVYAQPVNYVVLTKPGKTKRYTFIEGQEITYKLKKDIGFFTDRIFRITDTTLVFPDYTVAFGDIDIIYINKKKHFLSTNTILMYGVNVVAAAAILQVAYLVNTGAGYPTLGRDLLYVSTPIPLLFIVNGVYRLFVKTEYKLEPGGYKLNPVILRKDPSEILQPR
jgi:hypothetical protein